MVVDPDGRPPVTGDNKPYEAAAVAGTAKRIERQGVDVPSTLVHLAFAGFLVVGLLGPAFGRRSVAFVFVVTALPDLDSFASLFLPGAHRALLHSFVFVAVFGGLVAVDRRWDGSLLRRWFDEQARRVGAVAVVALAFAGVAPDLVISGINPLYPLVDQFYTFSGEVRLSSTRGIVQTFVDLQPEPTRSATTGSRFYSTGVDPVRGAEPKNVERVFPVLNSGLELLVVLTGALVVWGRFRDEGAIEE